VDDQGSHLSDFRGQSWASRGTKEMAPRSRRSSGLHEECRAKACGGRAPDAGMFFRGICEGGEKGVDGASFTPRGVAGSSLEFGEALFDFIAEIDQRSA